MKVFLFHEQIKACRPLTEDRGDVSIAGVDRSHGVEVVAVVGELTTPLFRQDVVLLVLDLVARVVQEGLAATAVCRRDEGAE